MYIIFLVGDADEGGVSNGDGGAGMVDGDPRQGADLKKQIGLFVEMSTPFFKVNLQADSALLSVVGTDHKRNGTRYSYLGLYKACPLFPWRL